MIKVNNRNIRNKYEICSKLNFISHVFLVFLLLTLSRELLAENTTNVSATQNEHYQKINANYKNNNPRKQNKFKRNPKNIKKTF